MRRTKGFTLVELLVVIGIIALLVSILMPALGRARELAKRIQCASQLNGLGKAITLYQNEYRDANPRPWRTGGNWGFGGTGGNTLYNDGANLGNPPGIGKPRWANGNFDFDNASSVGGCLWLLVRHEDVDPKMFICPSAPNDREMNLEDAIEVAIQSSFDAVENWSDICDFQDGYSLSYSFNDPWNRPLDSSASASMALMADKSNAYDTSDFHINDGDCGQSPLAYPAPNMANLGTPNPDCQWDDDEGANPGHGNSNNHQSECQNVMFADTHAKKFNTPLVGVRDDNIYSFATANTPANQPFTYYMIGQWRFSGNGDGFMYDQAGVGGPEDDDSYLGN
jgi:prepilin-type N-terminal cleavage/methylation domain-containing protein